MLPAADPRIRFAADRAHFERIVFSRFARTLTREDVEDVVSDAILDAAPHCPADAVDGGRAWFTRVCLNRAHDVRRARDGRPRSSRGASATSAARRFVALDDPSIAGRLVADARPDEEAERRVERAETRAVVERALAAIAGEDAELLRRRHLGPDELPREQVAAQLGLSLASFELRATRARKAFASALRAELT